MKPHEAALRLTGDASGDDQRPSPTAREAHVTHPSPIIPPAGRYGRTGAASTGRRWIVPAIVLAVLGTGVFIWLGSGVARDPVQWQDVGFSIAGPQSIDVTFEVTKAPDTTVQCRVQALNQGFAEVGVSSVEIGPSTARVQRFTVTVATSELAVSGTVDGCALVLHG